MTLRETLIEFFERFFGYQVIYDGEIKSTFNKITEYRYSTPTAYSYFKDVLVSSGFIEKENKKTYRFNWIKIMSQFKELDDKRKEFIKKNKGVKN